MLILPNNEKCINMRCPVQKLLIIIQHHKEAATALCHIPQGVKCNILISPHSPRWKGIDHFLTLFSLKSVAFHSD